MIKIGKVIGDVIEAGGVKNVTNNYYDGRQPGDEGNGDMVVEADEEVPEPLRGERAELLMESLVGAGRLDEGWQPRGLSGSEQALTARAVSERLGINDVWQVFGALWRVKPSTLRAYFNRALTQKKSLRFQDLLKETID